MRTLIINQTSARAPRAWMTTWLRNLDRALARRGHAGLGKKEITVVLVTSAEMARLNDQYRGKNYPTDVLSFEPSDPESIGELVVCPEVLREQSERTGLTPRLELGYMLVHGVLHLLGYDHETGPEDEARMFELQDEIFAKLRRKR